MDREPDWALLERANLLSKGAASELSKLHGLSSNEKADAIEQNPALVIALVNVLRLETDPHPAQYALTVLYEIVRENSSRYDVMCAALEGNPVYEDFMQLLNRRGIDPYTGDRAAFMLSGFMSRARTHTFSEDEVQHFVLGLISNKFPVSESGRLDALVNILKIDRWRPLVWGTRNVPETLLRGLALTQPAGVVYKAVFCVWLLSFHEGFSLTLTSSGIVQAVCGVVTESRVEKVVRVGLHVVENLLSCEEAVEIIIEQNVAQVLALLEFEKWRDADMYDEIRACIFALDVKIKQFNNFERYLMELDKGRLKWSVLHSVGSLLSLEKFWRENVMVFEKDEFATIQKIEKLLDSEDPTTQAVACYDLGEFARLHPAGKKVCQKFKVKDKVMLLITNKHREVAGEALLSSSSDPLSFCASATHPQRALAAETEATLFSQFVAKLGQGSEGPPARAPTRAPGARATTRKPPETFEAPTFDVAGGAPQENPRQRKQSARESFAPPTLAVAGLPFPEAAGGGGEPAFAPPSFGVAEPTESANAEEEGNAQFQPPTFGVAEPINLQQQQEEEERQAKEAEEQEAAETENFVAPAFGASAPGVEGLGGGAYTPEGRSLRGPSVGPESPHAAVGGSAEAEANEREARLREKELELQRLQEHLQQQQQLLQQQQQQQSQQPPMPYQQQQPPQLEPVLSAIQQLDQRIAELHALAQQQQQQQQELLRQHHERLEQALQQQQQQQQQQPQEVQPQQQPQPQEVQPQQQQQPQEVQPQQPPVPTETLATAAPRAAAEAASPVEQARPAAAAASAAAPSLPPTATPPITIQNCACLGNREQRALTPFKLPLSLSSLQAAVMMMTKKEKATSGLGFTKSHGFWKPEKP
ncbi:hypothetical protein Emag_003844 [Eimeria magna]